MATLYQVTRPWSGVSRGDLIEIDDAVRAARLRRGGHVLPAPDSLAEPAPQSAVDAAALYGIGSQTVASMPLHLAEIEDVSLLRLALEYETRVGATRALTARLEELKE